MTVEAESMVTVELQNVEAELKRLADAGISESEFLLCLDGKPIARLHWEGEDASSSTPRPIGLAAGTFEVPPGFFEPLPDELLDAFSGAGP